MLPLSITRRANSNAPASLSNRSTLQEIRDFLQQLPKGEFMDQGPLHRLLREHPRTINQKLRQTVLEELIENGYPHLMFDNDVVELLGPSQKRNRLRNVVFGHPVDKVNILSPLNCILG